MKKTLNALLCIVLAFCMIFAFCSCSIGSFAEFFAKDKSTNEIAPELNFFRAKKNLEAAGYTVQTDRKTVGAGKQINVLHSDGGCGIAIVFTLLKFKSAKLARIYYELEKSSIEANKIAQGYTLTIQNYLLEEYGDSLDNEKLTNLNSHKESIEQWFETYGEERIVGISGNKVWIGDPEMLKFTYAKNSAEYKAAMEYDFTAPGYNPAEYPVQTGISAPDASEIPEFDFGIAGKNLYGNGYYSTDRTETGIGEKKRMTVSDNPHNFPVILTVYECTDPTLAAYYYEKNRLDLEYRRESVELQLEFWRSMKSGALLVFLIAGAHSIDYYKNQLEEIEKETVGISGNFVWWGSTDAISSTHSTNQ